MKRSRILIRTVLLLILIGLSLAACVAEPGGHAYERYPYYPAYGVFDYDYGGWGGWHHGWDHSHWDHGGWGGWDHDSDHGGWGHGFAHGGFGGHGGGGHR